MFNTPKKLKQQHLNGMDAKENNPQLGNLTASTPNPSTNATALTSTNNTASSAAATTTTIIFENGTMFGAISNDTPNAKLSGTATPYLSIPEIVISCSTNSLNRNRCESSTAAIANSEDTAVESTALLESTSSAKDGEQSADDEHLDNSQELNDEPHMLADEFEQFILNRTTSDSNILESSIYSELQFPPSMNGGAGGASAGSIMSGHTGNGGYLSSSGGPITSTPQMAAPQTAAQQTAARQTKRTKRKHKTKSKCTATAATLAAAAAAGQRASPTHYPPRYTAIFMDPHQSQYGNVMATHHNGNAANALGQIASAAASSPFLNAPVVGGDSAAAAAAAAYMQQFQYFQQRPMVTTMGPLAGGHHRRHHRTLFDVANPPTTAIGIDNPLALHSNASTPTVPASVISSPFRLSFRKWFSRPSLPFIIGILALGGVACTLGGIVLGSTGLIEHSTQYLSAALLMIGIGVSLLVISGAIWRLSLPDDVEECPCYRHMEMCRNCNSPYCNSRLVSGSYLYPEFQHRPPPPSYLTSLNECAGMQAAAGMSLLFHPTASAQQAAQYSTIRVNTPPPLYRSTNSLSCFGATIPAGNGPSSNLVPSLATSGNSVGIVPDHSVITMSQVMENLQTAHAHALIKDFNYLELD